MLTHGVNSTGVFLIAPAIESSLYPSGVVGGSKQETPDLQVGFKAGGFYGIFQEIGTEKQPKIAALTTSTEGNVATIQKIQQQYLSAVGSESAESMIDEGEYSGE